MKRVLITDDVHALLLEGLEKEGYSVDYRPKISQDEVISVIHLYDGVVINTKTKAYAPLLEKAKKLKFIGRLGSGLDIIDLPLAAQKGIRVYSAPEGNRNAVAEQALGMLLALLHKLPAADRTVREGLPWNREAYRGRELMNLTVGVVGCGNTGSSFVKKLGGMGVKVLIHDKYRHFLAEGISWASQCTLTELQENADVISLHLPLTSETQYLVNDEFMNRCKKGVILINTCRGKVVDTKSLTEHLKTGQIGGACLDVFENEHPDTFSTQEKALYTRLYEFPQVVLSPHVAGWSVQSKKRIAEVLLSKICHSVGIQTNDIPQL